MKASTVIIALLGFAQAVVASGPETCVGEAGTVSPCFPRIIPGSPGVHTVIMDPSTGFTGINPACGGSNVGHSVWFSITPDSNHVITVDTCHPTTDYDTVLQVWKATGDCEFPEIIENLCIDDTVNPTCFNICQQNPRKSRVTFQGVIGQEYHIQVGSYNNNLANCPLCLGLTVTVCNDDSTPPTTLISSPLSTSCVGGVVQVVGTVQDPQGTFQSYTLEYKAAGANNWTEISSGTFSIINGVLGNWNTAGLTQGFYFLRLTTLNTCGKSDTDVKVVWLNQGVDNADLQSPQFQEVVGGMVCAEGTANDPNCFDHYQVNYRPAQGGAFTPVNPGIPTYVDPVINGRLAVWDTILPGAGDGSYELQLDAFSLNGHLASVQTAVTVDNTPPVALIQSPGNCQYVEGTVPVIGTVQDANLGSWELQYTGGDTNGWVTIASDVVPVQEGILGFWETGGLTSCAYTLRLRARDRAKVDCGTALPHTTEFETSVNVGSCGDFDTDDDGDVDLFDYRQFNEAYTGPLP